MAESEVTEKRDLHEARPLWADSPRISVRSGRTPKSRRYDVIIVGAGISGALMAHALADGKRSVAVIDRRAPVKGSSMASTAMIQHEIDVPLHELAGTIGKARAERVWRRSAHAVDGLKALVDELGSANYFQALRDCVLAKDIN